jgi:hypothetical protein
MTAKESTSKLTPNERLARKRAAARLRQQRCRARKRQTVVEQKRLQHGKMVQQDSKQHTSSAFRTRHPMTNDTSISPSLPSHQPIYNCVSFESQRSFEEAMRVQEISPTGSPTLRGATSPPRKTIEVISIPEEKSGDSLVPDEEAAAIAAMLSLKTSPTSTKRPCAMEGHARPRQAPPKVPFYGNWEAHRYMKPRYGLQPRVPQYHGGMSHQPRPHPPRPHPHFRYYPSSFQRFVRYD